MIHADGTAVGSRLKHTHGCILKDPAVFFFSLNESVFGFPSPGYVIGGDQFGVDSVESQVMPNDFALNDGPVFFRWRQVSAS